jgi:hypothetical protein
MYSSQLPFTYICSLFSNTLQLTPSLTRLLKIYFRLLLLLQLIPVHSHLLLFTLIKSHLLPFLQFTLVHSHLLPFTPLTPNYSLYSSLLPLLLCQTKEKSGVSGSIRSIKMCSCAQCAMQEKLVCCRDIPWLAPVEQEPDLLHPGHPPLETQSTSSSQQGWIWTV